MNIVFIGAGNVATNLCRAFYRNGHDILQVFSRTSDSADRMSDLFECSATTNIDDVRKDADVYVFAVKDSVLEELAIRLAARIPDKMFVHTAGSMPLEVLKVTHKAVMYPMQTFSKFREVDMRDVPVFVEAATREDLSVVRALSESVSSNVREMSSEDRRYLHLAAVYCCNFVNHCYVLGAEVLSRRGIPFDVMLPLIDETASKVHSCTPSKAQTGPAIRWDENVIEKHRQLLNDAPSLRELYDMFSKSIHDRNSNVVVSDE